MGVRQDQHERAELTKGSVDFVASNEYMNRPPMPPIDSGYLPICTGTIKNIIEN